MKTIANYPIKYYGSIFWLVILLILYFPFRVLLLLSGIKIKLKNESYGLQYKASFGWLIFWTIVFFPVAIILVSVFVNNK